MDLFNFLAGLGLLWKSDHDAERKLAAARTEGERARIRRDRNLTVLLVALTPILCLFVMLAMLGGC